MTKSVTKILFVLVTLMSIQSISLALDPQKSLTQYGHEVWNEDRGLPQSSVTNIVQTPDGYLWLGTQEGLVRFDGVKFDVFDKSNTSVIRNNFVSCLLVAKDSTLWFGTKSGLCTYKRGVFSNLSLNDSIPGNEVISI